MACGSWPRYPDYAISINATALTGGSTVGQMFAFGKKGERIAAIVVGTFSNVSWSKGATSANWIPWQPSGLVFPASQTVPLRLRQDAGAAGVLQILAWEVGPEEDFREVSAIIAAFASGAVKGLPFPDATALPILGVSETPANVSRIGVYPLLNSGTNNYNPLTVRGSNVDGMTPGVLGSGNGMLQEVAALNEVFNDRTVLNDRMRQPDSFVPQFILNSAISTASTGVKATITMAQNGIFLGASMAPITGVPTGAQALLQVVRSAVTYLLGQFGPAVGGLNDVYCPFVVVTPGAPFTSQAYPVPPGFPLIAGDVIQVNVNATSAASTSDFMLAIKRDRFAF